MDTNATAKTIIAEDVEITGSIKTSSPIRIDGKLNGDLTCGGHAVIGASAHVKGNISVESVSVEGHVTGNITARDRIELKASTNLNGDIRAKRLTVEDGVTFVGKSEVNPSGSAAPKSTDSRTPELAETPAGGDREKDKGGVFPKR